MFSQNQINQFKSQGFVISRNLTSPEICRAMLDVVQTSNNPLLAPVEFEVQVQYTGAPSDRLSLGGDTRDSIFRKWATTPAITNRVRQLLCTKDIAVSQNHHNCIITKYPCLTVLLCGIRIYAFGCLISLI